MKKGVKALYFIIGLIGVVVLFFTSDLENADWSFFLSLNFLKLFSILLSIWAIIYAVHTCTFKVILGENRKDIKFFRLYKICLTGFSLNNVTPAGVAGGEPYRIMELSRYTKTEKAAATSLTFTLLYMTGHFMIWVTEAIVYYILGCPGESFSTIIITAVGIISLGAVSVITLAKSEHIVEKTILLLARLPLIGKYLKKFYEAKKNKLQAIDAEITAFKRHPKQLALTMVLEYVTRLLECLEYYLIFRFLKVDIPVIAGLMILSNASLMGNILFFIPMQVGSRESGMKFALSWFTKSTSSIAPACIIYRIRDLFCTFVGVMCMLIEKKRNN